ncbi:MAG: PPOX class F420-dependent oxidoreductase [Lacisediminihabitans sp.]
MTSSTALLDLGSEDFVSLTTFRKTGERVSTPVWIARDGDALLVTTPEGTGKLKRLRNNPTVELQPSSRMGKTKDSDPIVTGIATMAPEAPRETELFREKYGLQYRIFMFIERRMNSRAGATGQKPRVILRITSPE